MWVNKQKKKGSNIRWFYFSLAGQFWFFPFFSGVKFYRIYTFDSILIGRVGLDLVQHQPTYNHNPQNVNLKQMQYDVAIIIKYVLANDSYKLFDESDKFLTNSDWFLCVKSQHIIQ